MSTSTYGIDEFLDDATSLVGRHGPTAETFEKVGDLLRRLGRQPEAISEADLAGLHGTDAAATILGRGSDGSVLMLARFPAESPTPVHNHNSWGVVYVLRGKDRYSRWERLDDGSDPRVVLAEEQVLAEGDVVYFGEPPDDVHSQQGIDGDAWELVYFGRDPNAQPRAYFDPETGSVRHASAMARPSEGRR